MAFRQHYDRKHNQITKKLALLLSVHIDSLSLIIASLNLKFVRSLKSKFTNLDRVNQVIIVGCLLVINIACTFPTWLIYSQNNISYASAEQEVQPYGTPKNSVAGKPVTISIPSLQIYLPVIDGHYDADTHNWTLTDNSAQFMVDSAKPNNVGGKTFIYGHALMNIFGKLPNIQPGAKLSLTTDNGYRFNYRFDSSFATSPSDLSVLDNTKKPVLYLQTCSGAFYQNRQIFSFKYIDYEKIKS
jgi:LPXTG-site transpeptidase (sortase) family protein